MSSEAACTSSEGRLFIISGPAGVGKTTLVNRLKEEFSSIKESVSYTTRAVRPGERDGVDYMFISREAFEEKIAAGAFLEYVEFSGHYYGTAQAWVDKHRKRGEHIVLVIDTRGALELKKGDPQICSIFISPPSLEELRRRLIARQTESAQSIERRCAIAEREILTSDVYDYQIVNKDVESAYQVLRSIMIAEEHRTNRSH